MNYELNAYVDDAVVKIFMKNTAVMNEKNITKIIHSHKYTEFHIVFGGDLEILIDNKKYKFSSGDIYAIPSRMYHCYLKTAPQTRIIAFQADIFLKEFKRSSISEAIIEEILDIMKNDCFISDCSGITSLFSFVVSKFYPPAPIKHSKDDAILIYEFISNNYNKNITISELSKVLCLSDKQTERLVKKYTGYSFKKTIINYRIKVANFLAKNTNMTEVEISDYIGYANYSGYWKAKKLFENNQPSETEN